MFKITLPPCASHSESKNVIQTLSPLVIVGANGSGKSRLAIWLEQKAPQITHRVSAQRMLSFPKDLRGTNIDQAEADLLYGNPDFNQDRASTKFIFRYSNAADAALNDFQKLATLLFSESSQATADYYQRMRETTTYTVPPIRRLDIIKAIWEEILPKRELIIGGHKIDARQKGFTNSYSAHEMSDGERVIFYLIGQCLCAPKNGILIIDEPELHLHQALQRRLWDAVEAERKDCLFIYITHDLEFAATRNAGTMIWVNEYAGADNWQWDIVPKGTLFPQALLLEILGSRRPVLFVEGKRGGVDEMIYSILYPKLHVIAVGGCESVVHLTYSARNLKQLGQLQTETYGLVDHDGRDAASVQVLASGGVAVLPASEIENILMSEVVIRDISTWQNRNPESDFSAVQLEVLNHFGQHRDRLIAEIAGREIERKLRGWKWKHPDGAILKASLRTYTQGIDADRELAKAADEVNQVIADKDYKGVLRIFPNKGMTSIAGRLLGVTDFIDCITRRLAAKEGAALVQALKSTVPSII